MARPKKPTHLLNSHGYSKEQLKEMERLEEEMCGNDDIVGVDETCKPLIGHLQESLTSPQHINKLLGFLLAAHRP